MPLNWNSKGFLPPIDPQAQGHSPLRSPYRVAMRDVIHRFAISQERQRILLGLLAYRQALYASGIKLGFQWLNGSFMENIEATQSRPPNDIDVVTFFQLPNSQSQSDFLAQNPQLFDTQHIKITYKVDAYPFVLGDPFQAYHAKHIAYWYSMWSHTRTHEWKGFLHVDLDQHGDQVCHTILNPLQKSERERGEIS